MNAIRLVLLEPGNGRLGGLEAALRERAAVETVDTVKAWLHPARRERADVLVVHFEHGDGVTRGVEALRLAREHSDVAVLAVTDGDDAASVAEAIEEGATEAMSLEPPLEPKVRALLTKLGRWQRLRSRTRSLVEETARLHRAEEDRYRIVGESPQMKEVLERIRRVARIPRPVLLLGERGTGKELVARAVHREGASSEGPFVAVNCAALPDTLLESELFGHEKGAFTGAASASRGKFEQASRGTLFLDEIGNMSLPFQQKILRVVEYKRFSRVGGTSEIEVATRIIAATNADLEERMRTGHFLHDLYDRLAFEVIRVPPLRERVGDIEVLAQHFLSQFMREVPAFAGKSLSQKAIDLLHTYSFPGNVRELKNIIERAVYRDTTNELDPEDIGLLADHHFQAPGGSFKDKVAAFERQLLADALRASGANRAEAARALGLRYHQLRHFLAKHGLDEK